jgi:hypothetical protein
VFTNFLGTDLERSDIEALASLPRLKFEIDDLYVMSDDIIPSLSLLNGLKHLEIRWSEELANILPSIGRNLVRLNVRSATAETWLGIVEKTFRILRLTAAILTRRLLSFSMMG